MQYSCRVESNKTNKNPTNKCQTTTNVGLNSKNESMVTNLGLNLGSVLTYELTYEPTGKLAALI